MFRSQIARRHACGLILAVTAGSAAADSSSPLLAAYYDRQMAIVGGAVYAWEGTDRPKHLAATGVQVGVGRDAYYLLDVSGALRMYGDDLARSRAVATGVAKFAAGDAGVMIIAADGALHWLSGGTGAPVRIADDAVTAAVGDGANYYVARGGALFVRGKAHRGQYGDGKLLATDAFVSTAAGVAAITAHTGHAILMTADGDVLGTGGNIYGPVGRHGLGDKADRWSLIATGARAIATGASHSLAILKDDTLIAWGRGYRPDPEPVMTDVAAVAAGTYTTIALKRDGSLWQWGWGRPPRRLELP